MTPDVKNKFLKKLRPIEKRQEGFLFYIFDWSKLLYQQQILRDHRGKIIGNSYGTSQST